MKQFVRDYLTFNKRERNGLFVLLAIITFLIVYLSISDKFIKPEIVDFTKFEKEIEVFNASVQQANVLLKQEREKKFKTVSFVDTTVKKQSERFNFNPNNLSEEDWKRIGLSNKQIQTIKNYEAKGGKFRSKEDVKKMYCITEELYLSLEQYIQIPEEKNLNTNNQPSARKETPKAEFKNTKPANKIIELNSADSALLTHLRGVGPFYAKIIVKYRVMLGGFVTKEQLMEVWNFDKNKFDEVEKYVTVDASKIKKININTCSSDELKHPYLKWNAVNGIINYRKNHGKYKTVDEIKKTDLVDDETYRKIVPYLTIE